jgi:uncharacterized protein (DUF169 family)
MEPTFPQTAPLATPTPSMLNERLVRSLRPFAAPVAIRFLSTGSVAPAPRLQDPAAPPNEYGRTGQVAAGCVFWIRGAERTFATVAADHGNCSVGSLTHGFISLEEAAARDDVAAVLASGWVDPEAVAALPRIMTTPATVVYGPLEDSAELPDVVLLRINALALMTLSSAIPDLRIEGKPQCHIVALAREEHAVAASVGCALSRARTGMRSGEMTCAIPGERLAEVVEAVEATLRLDRTMARYAAADAVRFPQKAT